LWFRQDLRLADHPALIAAIGSGYPVIPVYVFDDETPGEWGPGGATRWWLAMALQSLDKSIVAAGSKLIVLRGIATNEITKLAREARATGVYFSRQYEPWAIAEENELKRRLADEDVEAHRYSGCLLTEPETVKTQAGEAFRVFTPFARAVDALPAVRSPTSRPSRIPAPEYWPPGISVADLGLLPIKPDWAGGLRDSWAPGEAGAEERLDTFLGAAIASYRRDRDFPAVAGTSRLSPHLHFGEISPATCWQKISDALSRNSAIAEGAGKFKRELLWREFSYHLLFSFPGLPQRPFRPEFANFPWQGDPSSLEAWQRGLTGYPIVDAGMRELWQTGYMHNRVRMIVASFLVKDLLVPWQDGARWFWDTLVDADLANNSASWQWVAGCGADAAPYFRIFNPIKQGEKFDPEGQYVRRFVGELSGLPAKYIHVPFAAPPEVLESAGIKLGENYPHPIVDHAMARKIALESFAKIRSV